MLGSGVSLVCCVVLRCNALYCGAIHCAGDAELWGGVLVECRDQALFFLALKGCIGSKKSNISRVDRG